MANLYLCFGVTYFLCLRASDLYTDNAHLAIMLSIYGSTALVDLGRYFSLLSYTQSVGLLGWAISPS
jgi:hypothetical protein